MKIAPRLTVTKQSVKPATHSLDAKEPERLTARNCHVARFTFPPPWIKIVTAKSFTDCVHDIKMATACLLVTDAGLNPKRKAFSDLVQQVVTDVVNSLTFAIKLKALTVTIDITAAMENT